MATPATSRSVLTRRGILAATASTLLLSACGRDRERRNAVTRPTPGQELVVGATLELSGSGAALGVAQQRALTISAATLNDKGVQVGNLRRTVRLELRDNRSDPRLAAEQAAGRAYRDLVSRYIREHGAYNGFAPYASDALLLITTAARLASSVDRGRLRAYLQNQVTDGMAGMYSFTPIRHSGMERHSLGVYRVDAGAWNRLS
ncbi:hypothetical protein ABT008_11780 [Micromonospora sp. NPDC002389]|uniref:hypothetical protein n=1 Tax=Micromonospora sp. NPDC002389 TaxID=3154272 RepID=UPI00332670B9